jgi:hypothetical protein
LRPFSYFTLAQQASCVFGGVFVVFLFSIFFAPLLCFSRLHSKLVAFLVVFFAFGDLFFAPLFFLRLHSKRSYRYGFRHSYFLRPFFFFSRLHSKRVLLFVVFFAFGDFIFTPPFFSRLHSKRVLLFVVFFAFGDFIFAPPFFFHACTASVFCFLW